MLILLHAPFILTVCRSEKAAVPPTSLRATNAAADAVNINIATPAELETLPGIGGSRAAKIIEYREKYGPFRRAEHLMLVDGISETLFRKIQDRIRTE